MKRDRRPEDQFPSQTLCGGCAVITSDEDYYFALGQILVHVFTVMGGVDRYRKEFNYLTNPSLAYPVQKLNSRIVHFLGRARDRYQLGTDAEQLLDAVLSYQPGHQDESRHIESLDDAFYSGIHADTILGRKDSSGGQA